VDVDAVLAGLYVLVAPHLTEKQRRLLAGAAAKALGRGGGARMARLTGLSRPTVYAGVRELDAPPDPSGRIRRPGGGPKRLVERQPGLLHALDELVDPDTRGAPTSPLRWTCKSTRQLADALGAQGFQVSDDTVGRLLKQQGYTLQRTLKTEEGAQHPDRDAQFRYLNQQAREHLAAFQPVVSVDTKKKELVGSYANGGAEWQPAGEPERVGVHDFLDQELGKAIPYGVYDLGANAGWVSVGTDHDTAAFAVATLRRWWEQQGKAMYSEAERLLVCADAGGSNGYRVRGVEDRTGPVRGRDGPGGDGVPLPARHLQVEQGRASAVQPHLDQLAGPAAGLPPGDRRADRRDPDPLGPAGARGAGPGQLSAGRQGL
jgi:Rhodopirellula transposase DDE domain